MRPDLWRTMVLATWMVGALPQIAAAQAAAIPLSLDVTATPAEVTVGEKARLVVTLKSYKGDAIPASEPVTVTLHSEISGDTSITLKPGQTAAATAVRFPRSGIATVVATAPKLTSGSVAVVVKATPISVTEQPSPRAEEPAVDRGATLAIDVLPRHVHPANALWRAVVLVTAIDDTRQPIAVPVDTSVHLATDIGVVTPAHARISAGKALTDDIQVTATRAGSGTLWAWTDAGTLVAATVEYHEAVPTQLLVKALPARSVNDGRTAVRVTVFLQDDTAATASADQDVMVNLTSSVGSMRPSEVSIPKGKFFAEAVLTSPVSGQAEITATSARLKPGSARTEFVFPLLLVILAGTGGLVGSVARAGRRLLTGAWWWQVASSIAMGFVLGLAFYALALFGIIASIPKLSIPLAQLPTTNDLGALVLGFMGGYYARAWLPEPDARRPRARPAPRTVSHQAG